MIDAKVLERVFDHAAYVDLNLPAGHHRLFTALQGSQNYGLSDAESDVDTKSLTIPSFENLVFNRKRLSTTLEVAPTIEHADVKDVREMFNCFRKQNINFVEILFTPYVDVAPNSMKFYLELHNRREDIAHYNRHQALHAMCGHMMEKYHAFDHPYPSRMDYINKYGYDPKQLHHQIRFKEFLERYFKDEPYEDCMKPRDPEYLKAVKRGLLPLDEARVLREELKAWQEKFLAEMHEKVPDQPNEELDKWMDALVYEAFMDMYKEKGFR